MSPLLSPCTRVCFIDPVSGLCQGCGLTLDEIAGWSGLSPDERESITASLVGRLLTRESKPAAAP